MTAARLRWMGMICFFLSLLAQASSAEFPRRQGPEYLFYKANLAYEAAKYDEAIAQYSLILQQGFESGPLYYNRGNSYFKKGEIGQAILNYERAKRIIPWDGDLDANDEYARSFIRENPKESSGAWYENAADKIFKSISIDGLTIFLSVTYLFSLTLLTAGLYLERMKRYSKSIVSICILILVVGGFGLYQKAVLLEKEAIVIVEKSEAKFEPFDRATTHFILYEGMKVQVLAEKKEWVKIKQIGKKIGWVKASSIEIF